MIQLPHFEELKHRIQVDIDYLGGQLPEPNALVWYGYIAALIEWGLITVSEHDQLRDMLPDIPNNPVKSVLLGRSEE